MTDEIRVSFISPIMPDRTGNGLAMRMGMFLEALAQDAAVDLIVVPVAGGAVEPSAFACKFARKIWRVDIAQRQDTSLRLLSVIDDPDLRLKHFRSYGKPSLTGFLSAAVREELASILQLARPDQLHVARAYLASCIDLIPSGAKFTSLDLDEDDRRSCLSQASVLAQEGEHASAAWQEQEARAFSHHVGLYAQRFICQFISSQVDHGSIIDAHRQLNPIIIGNAVDVAPLKVRGSARSGMLFVGNLSYAPNIDGLRWFIREVMPLIAEITSSTSSLTIAGSHLSPTVRELALSPGVRLVENAASLTRYYDAARIAIAPMRSGAGVRIKCLEAAAHGTPLVATSAAIEGSGLSAPSHCWTADTAPEFAKACTEAMSENSEPADRAAAARKVVEMLHNRSNRVEEIRRTFRSKRASFINDKHPV